MSKMNELSQVLDELIAYGEKLTETAKAIRQTFGEPEAKPEVKTYSFTDVRQAFAAKSHAGYMEQIKALITSYGATRLSDIKEEDYAAIMADMEAIE